MKRYCPHPECLSDRVIRAGFFHRPSDGRNVQRFQCKECHATFSEATGTPTFGQKKRRLNHLILMDLASSASQNRIALNHRTTRKTVARKLVFLGIECARMNTEFNEACPLAKSVQFDELETHEHTKCKPLSVAVAVEKGTRRILGLRISTMPAKGRLAAISLRKYGNRKDTRSRELRSLLNGIAPICAEKLVLHSDMCPRYAPAVRATLGTMPGKEVKYRQTKGALGSDTGQGELKLLPFDPLFSINHTLGMFRANVNRLFRKTWNTTKRVDRLQHHLHIYAYFHNTQLIKPIFPPTA